MAGTAPYLKEVPIFDNVLQPSGKITDRWNQWFTEIIKTTGFIVAHDRFTDTGAEVAVNVIVGGSTAKRNLLDNAVNGTLWYNTDTNVFNFRQGGAWVTFTPIPA